MLASSSQTELTGSIITALGAVLGAIAGGVTPALIKWWLNHPRRKPEKDPAFSQVSRIRNGTPITASGIRADNHSTELSQSIRPKKTALTGFVLLVFSAFLWACANVIIKHLSDSRWHPAVLSAGLYISAFSFLMPVAVIACIVRGQKLSWRHAAKPAMPLSIAKATETLLFVCAVTYITASQTTMLVKFNAVWLFLILLLTRKVRDLLGLIGSVATFAGVVVLLWRTNSDAHVSAAEGLIGSALALGCGLAFAVFTYYLEWHPSLPGPGAFLQRILFTALLMGATFVLLVPFSIFVLPPEIPKVSQLVWVWVAGGVCLGGAYFCFLWGVEQTRSLVAITIHAFTVPFTVIIEALFLGLHVTWNLLVGGLLILYGVVIVTALVDQSRKNEEQVQETGEDAFGIVKSHTSEA